MGHCVAGALTALASVNGGAARAQTASTLIAPTIAPAYARGRNVSVTEVTDPAYRATGLRLGALALYPAIETATHYTTNVYLDDRGRREDAFVTIAPRVTLTSDWARHRISMQAQAEFRRYAHETQRDQDNFLIDAQARLDMSSHWTVTAGLLAARATENPFGQDLASAGAVFSQYVRVTPSLRVIRQVGRTRLIASIERLRLDFEPIDVAGGDAQSQDDRNRVVTRLAAQGEYALSPSLSLYAQVNRDETRYDRMLANGNHNRDSAAFLIIGGLTLDIAGLMRGSVGIGHTRRDYRAPLYKDVDAFSVQARMEIFPSPLTTVTLNAQRLVQDAALGNISAYRDTRADVRIDHALLRNLLLTMTGTWARQTLLDDQRGTRLFITSGSAFYQSSRAFGLGLSIQYNQSRPFARSFGVRSDELVAMLRLNFRR